MMLLRGVDPFPSPSDQDIISPYNFNAISHTEVMRMK